MSTWYWQDPHSEVMGLEERVDPPIRFVASAAPHLRYVVGFPGAQTNETTCAQNLVTHFGKVVDVVVAEVILRPELLVAVLVQAVQKAPEYCNEYSVGARWKWRTRFYKEAREPHQAPYWHACDWCRLDLIPGSSRVQSLTAVRRSERLRAQAHLRRHQLQLAIAFDARP